jgi:hypothetical protein
MSTTTNPLENILMALNEIANLHRPASFTNMAAADKHQVRSDVRRELKLKKFS